MIQRIQSIWLLLSAAFSGLLIKGSIINFADKSGQKFFVGFSGIYKHVDSGNAIIRNSIPLEAIIVIIILLSLITIFLYKSRRTQRILSLILTSLSLCLVILVIFYSYILVKSYDAALIPGVKMVFPVLILIAVILAYIRINRDDRLVKSYDRLR